MKSEGAVTVEWIDRLRRFTNKRRSLLRAIRDEESECVNQTIVYDHYDLARAVLLRPHTFISASTTSRCLRENHETPGSRRRMCGRLRSNRPHIIRASNRLSACQTAIANIPRTRGQMKAMPTPPSMLPSDRASQPGMEMKSRRST
jgi:hypothetical protein